MAYNQLVDVDLQDEKKIPQNNKLLSSIKTFYLIMFCTEWLIIMYWFVVGLQISMLLKLFVIINHLLLIHDYFHIYVFIERLVNKLSMYKTIYLIFGIYKIVFVQLCYTYTIISMYDQLIDVIFCIFFVVHYVYIIFVPLLYIHLLIINCRKN